MTALIWSTGEAPASLEGKHLLLHLHGYGSNEADLAGLFPYLPESLIQVSLRAPLAMGGPSFAWFPLTTPGNPAPEVVTAAAQALLDIVHQELLTLNPSSLGLLGFSQGGLMVTELFRQEPSTFRYGVNLSGFTAGGDRAADEQLASTKPPLFWGRDVADPVIMPAAIERTAEWLPQYFSVEYREYPGIQHSISREELDDVSAFILKHLQD